MNFEGLRSLQARHKHKHAQGGTWIDRYRQRQVFNRRMHLSQSYQVCTDLTSPRKGLAARRLPGEAHIQAGAHAACKQQLFEAHI